MKHLQPREFEGYASLFNEVDQMGDVVRFGAFDRALRARPRTEIKLLYQHDPHLPIGVWSCIEADDKGLYVRGRLLEGVERSEETLQLLRAGALDGLSIGFRTVRARRAARATTRELLEIDLWEISLVTFPMARRARVSAVGGSPDAETSRHTNTTQRGQAHPSVRRLAEGLTRAARELRA